MFVSVIIPCYNVSEYIEACLDSVRTQTYPHLEVICVDNNSGDNTYQVIERYGAQYPEFPLRLIREPKPGASAARNAGLQIATGEWIQFLDADDLLKPSKIQHQLQIVEESDNVSFIVGASIKKFADGREQVLSSHSEDPWLELPRVSLGNTCANLFRRDALLAIDGWREDLKSSQEYDLMFRLLRAGAQVLFDQKPLTIVRERVSGSISQVDVLGNNLRRLAHLCEVRHYFLEEQFEQSYVDNVNQCIFQEIRRIYRIDAPLALEKYRESFPVKPKIKATNATSRMYVRLYNLLGFEGAQSINRFYHQVRSTIKR